MEKLNSRPIQGFFQTVIDFIKARAVGVTFDSIQNLPLDFKEQFDVKLGISEGYFFAEYGEMEFKYFPESEYQSFFCEGSIHKLYNFHNKKESGLNYGDFYRHEIEKAVELISNLTQIASTRFVLHNVEYGINGTPPRCTSQYLKKSIFYKNKLFENRWFGGKGYQKKFIFSNYELKVYDKGLQYALDADTLRVEEKAKKMIHIQETGMKYLTDLYSPDKLEALRHKLTKSLNHLIIVDDSMLKEAQLNPLKRKDYLNPNYWEHLLDTDKRKFRRERKKLTKIIASQDNWQPVNELEKLITDKWNQLNS